MRDLTFLLLVATVATWGPWQLISLRDLLPGWRGGDRRA